MWFVCGYFKGLSLLLILREEMSDYWLYFVELIGLFVAQIGRAHV